MKSHFILLLFCLLSRSIIASESVDVVVLAATPAGIAAAVSAARSGARVVLVEESNHVGGIIAGGLTNMDIRKQGAVGGLYKEFQNRIRDHYVRTYGADSEAVKLCREGNMFEPKVGEAVFRQMLSGEKNIQLIEKHRIISARVVGSDGVEREAIGGARMDGAEPKEFGPKVKLVSITTSNLLKPSAMTELRAGCFIDASYEGDLAALAGAAYRVGRESRSAFKETHAGKFYARFKDYNSLPGSSGEGDNGIQAFCFRFHLTRDKANQTPVEQPAGFRREDFRNLLAQVADGKVTRLNQIIQLYAMPNGKFEVNSDHPSPETGVPAESLDLAEENYRWPEASAEERARIFDRYWAHNEGLIWLLQNEAEIPASIREEALQWGFPKDEFIDHRNRPHHIYVRQGRRIWGEYTLTENDAKPTFETGLPRCQSDGIAVAEYEFDSHAVSKYDPAHPGVREGYFFISHDPIQLPYRILIPKTVDGLLVPVACSASHVGYQTVRMEPVFMALGESCGIAAKTAQDSKVELRAVNVPTVQRELIKRGGVVLFENTALRPDGI